VTRLAVAIRVAVVEKLGTTPDAVLYVEAEPEGDEHPIDVKATSSLTARPVISIVYGPEPCTILWSSCALT